MPVPAHTRAAVKALTRAVENERDFAGWLAGVLAQVAAAEGSSAALTAGRPGSWEAALVGQLLAGTVGPGDEYLPDPEKDSDLHDHARPGTADMRAVLATARAILQGAGHGTTHQAAGAGNCPVCTAVAGISFGITLASTLAGDKVFVSEGLRRVMLAAVDATELELGSAPN